MAEVLSQSQIDALLNSMQNGGGAEERRKARNKIQKIRFLQSQEVYQGPPEDASDDL